MRVRFWAISLVAAAAIAACGEGVSRQQLSVTKSGSPLPIPSKSASVSLKAFAELLAAAQLDYSVGEADSPPELVFSMPIAVGIDQHNHALVLDYFDSNIRVLGHRGLPVSTFSGPGDGPDEIRGPVGIAFVEPDTVVVATSGGLKYFQVIDSLLYEYARMVHVADIPVPHAICSSATYIAIRAEYAALDTGIVTVVRRPTGETTRLGSGYLSDNRLARYELSRGPIACGDSAVTVAYSYLPTVRSYSLDGQLIWEAALADSRMLEFREFTVNGKLAFGMRPGTFGSTVTSLVQLDSHHLLLQVARLDQLPNDRGLYVTTRTTYVIDARTGESAFVSSQLPHLFRADAKGGLLAIEDTSGFIKVVRYALKAGRSR